ncbi:MAG: tetratricopeptide repeat protein [Chlorobi bacterium]|nr:tetratricopeptide repeat protein [Chlorobiota bacterium]
MKKYFAISFVLLLFLTASAFSSFAINKKDSLTNRLKTARSEDRLHTIDRLLVHTIYNDLDTSYYYATTLLKEAIASNNDLYESLAYSWLTVYSFFRGDYYKGEIFINKAIKIQEQLNDTMNLGNSYINLVMIYAETGRYKQAIESAFKALELFKSINHVHGIIVSNGNIGIMYNKLEDYETAVKYLKKTADLMFKNKEFSNLGELYNNMGISYYHLNINDSAIAYFHKAITEYNLNKEVKGTARAYLNLANTYAYNLKDYESAFSYYDLALKASEGVIDALKTKIFENKGKVYASIGDFSYAEKYLKMSLALAKESKDLEEQMTSYYELYIIYKKKNNLQEALNYYEKYNKLKDSIDVANAKVTIANLEANYENEKNLLQITELNIRREADAKIKNLLLIGMILLTLLLIMAIIVFIQKRKKALLRRELLKSDKEKLEKDLNFKIRQLTSQALLMIQKNQMLREVINTLKELANKTEETKPEVKRIIKQLKQNINTDEDWNTFRYYFEEINPDFYDKILKINNKITPSELKLAALIKLNFNIKETASLLNISPDSVKTTRHILRTKLSLAKEENIHEYLNAL